MNMQETLAGLTETIQTSRKAECLEVFHETLRQITRYIGLCFHLDTEVCEYISGVTEKPLFVGDELEALNQILTMMFTVVGDEAYEVCANEMEKMI